MHDSCDPTVHKKPLILNHANPISSGNMSRGRLFVFSICPSSPARSFASRHNSLQLSISSTFLISTLTSTTQHLQEREKKSKDITLVPCSDSSYLQPVDYPIDGSRAILNSDPDLTKQILQRCLQLLPLLPVQLGVGASPISSIILLPGVYCRS
ncbi:uncharacterized protein LAJ45_01827 [Morchella importuna]|uniref:uncharacterized protein n=1 Tax=Morchella importuna TaxID=1174673 RepID=UPI001E8D0887|nr:uncharacterized protein LAJ45_01827 [Morchella importuna]KAH8154060.1 hypothetical protein LAJ45_01827 [Morchella importuna]